MDSKIHNLVHMYGNWITDAIEIFHMCEPEEILPSLYGIEKLEKYITARKKTLTDEILGVFSLKAYWRETGDKVKIDSDVLEHMTGFKGSVTKFKRTLQIGGIPTEELILIHDKLVVNPEYYFEEKR